MTTGSYPDKLTEKELDKIIHDPVARSNLAMESLYWFSYLYLGNFADYPTAWFHREMFKLAEDSSVPFIDVCGFRGCGKSTVFTYSYPIWSIIGKQQKKMIVIISRSRERARDFLADIKRAFETKALLRADLGPFESLTDQWGAYGLVIPKYGAKIIAKSAGQSLRSVSHDSHRPDVVIMDDLESLESVKTAESRQKLMRWITGDVIPSGDPFKTKYVILGSVLHQDGVVLSFKNLIEENKMDGVFRAYPFFDQFGVPLWKEKFKTQADIDRQRKSVPTESAWQREFLLNLVPEDDQIIKSEWITDYDELPDIHDEATNFRYAVICADLAIKLGLKNDKTALITAYVYGYGRDLKVFILPNPINRRMEFPEQVDTLKLLSETVIPGQRTLIVVEEVGYQSALIQQLKSEGYPVEGYALRGDKEARLTVASPQIANKTVLFAKVGNEELKSQLTGFPYESHDDLCDSCSMLVNYVMNKNNEPVTEPELCIITGSYYDDEPRSGKKKRRIWI